MGDPWTDDDHLRFDVRFALSRLTVRGLRCALTKADRESMARAIVEHLRLCGWRWGRGSAETRPGSIPARRPVMPTRSSTIYILP
ncbi:hypothetical protein CCR97_00310 [Rhodoplanes elegans]|uniref:Uncharacterized protein n=1 Tax=Rhodoplanes elegans TaxID=29408 RepID=A0A327KLQ3_9BRAD|nr:hypothetical protein [Rhodoplanes elegans]MBK5956680.1 hypothetical protein [Rhodoplanes elegans]RAI39191.1 hypothetical protein CH338_10195 [Rhodoplanes elegans]